MARARTVITEPMIHLFLLILLDIAVRIFLLLLILLSTPWSCTKENKIYITSAYMTIIENSRGILCYVHAEVIGVVDANLAGLRLQALLFPSLFFYSP